MRIENVTNSMFEFYDDDIKELYVYSMKCDKCNYTSIAIMPDTPGEEYECSSCGNIRVVLEEEIVKKLVRN